MDWDINHTMAVLVEVMAGQWGSTLHGLGHKPHYGHPS